MHALINDNGHFVHQLCTIILEYIIQYWAVMHTIVRPYKHIIYS